MPGVKLSVVRIVMVGAAALLAAACSTTPDDKASNWGPARIYAEAKEELSAGAYDKAATLFERLEGQAAGTPLAQQAQLEKAYANFKAGESAQAEVHVARYYYRRGAYLAAINRAQSALADYREVPALEEALYIVAKSYEALGLLPLRDDALRVLTNNYPNSVFVSQGVRTAASPWWKLW